MAKHDLFTGDLYSHESWDQYWEGALKRVQREHRHGHDANQRLVCATMASTDRLNVIAHDPVRVDSRQPGRAPGHEWLPGHHAGGEVQLSRAAVDQVGSLRAIARRLRRDSADRLLRPTSSRSPSAPASKRVSGRFTLNVQSNPGWFRQRLDRLYLARQRHARPALLLHRRPAVPDRRSGHAQCVRLRRERGLHEARIDGGRSHFLSSRRSEEATSAARTCPFVSNRMNFSKVGAMVMYPIPKLRSLAFQLAYAYTVDGRNVGQANTFTIGSCTGTTSTGVHAMSTPRTRSFGSSLRVVTFVVTIIGASHRPACPHRRPRTTTPTPAPGR